MRVTVTRCRKGVFEVTEGPVGQERSWNARYSAATDVWHIENNKGTPIPPGSQLGQKIIKHIEAVLDDD